MFTPGAAMSTQSPKLEKEAREPELLVAATEMVLS
jgi:hypothetical protein